MEGRRTNVATYAEELQRLSRFSSTLSADADDAPDTSRSAERWTADADEVAFVRNDTAILPVGYGTVSLFARSELGPQPFRQYYQSRGIHLWQDRSATMVWRRFISTDLDVTRNGVYQAAGATATLTLAIWGMQSEAGTFASQYIETHNEPTTREADSCTVDPAPPQLLSGRWEVEIRPEADSIALQRAGSDQVIFELGDAGAALQLQPSESGPRIAVTHGTAVVTSLPLTFDAFQRITIRLEPAAGTVEIVGSSDGDGVQLGLPWTWDAGPLHIGRSADGTRPFFGAISRPHSW